MQRTFRSWEGEGHGESAIYDPAHLSYEKYDRGGGIVNRTDGTDKKSIYLRIFNNIIWSYLLWPPVNNRREKEQARNVDE